MSTAKDNTVAAPIDWHRRYEDFWHKTMDASHQLMGLREVARLAADPNVEFGRELGAIFDLFGRVLDDAIEALDVVPPSPAPRPEE